MNEMGSYLTIEMNRGKFPSAVLDVKKSGHHILEVSVGKVSPTRTDAPDQNTLYDLASLTKVVATLPSILYLIDHKELSLDSKVCKILPELNSEEKKEITVKNLLTHTAGFRSHVPFYQDIDSSKDFDIVKEINKIPLENARDSKVLYSDFGFILLGKMIERLTNERLDSFVTDKIFLPLEMNETCYKPVNSNKIKIAPTSKESCGIVHDENTRLMNGVSGHAGLFSTVDDLNQYIDFWRNKGSVKTKQIISEELMTKSIENQTGKLNDSRGLGWVRQNNSMGFFRNYSNEAYGHTGFTGTSILIDPINDCSVILLTNRVFIGRDESFISSRKRIHNEIFDKYIKISRS